MRISQSDGRQCRGYVSIFSRLLRLTLPDITTQIALACNTRALSTQPHPDVIAKIQDYLATARINSPNWPVKIEMK